MRCGHPGGNTVRLRTARVADERAGSHQVTCSPPKPPTAVSTPEKRPVKLPSRATLRVSESLASSPTCATSREALTPRTRNSTFAAATKAALTERCGLNSCTHPSSADTLSARSPGRAKVVPTRPPRVSGTEVCSVRLNRSANPLALGPPNVLSVKLLCQSWSTSSAAKGDRVTPPSWRGQDTSTRPPSTSLLNEPRLDAARLAALPNPLRRRSAA